MERDSVWLGERGRICRCGRKDRKKKNNNRHSLMERTYYHYGIVFYLPRYLYVSLASKLHYASWQSEKNLSSSAYSTSQEASPSL